MDAHATSEPSESGEAGGRVPGRVWTVRLDPVGRGSTAVRVSCSRPACAEQKLPAAAAGRTAATAHLSAHLRAGAGPRPEAYCACRAGGCGAHTDPVGGDERAAAAWRCGGPVVLAVIADRAGRWWRALECCARCAAASPGARVVAAAATAGGGERVRPAAAGAAPVPAAPAVGPQFSHRLPPGVVAAGPALPAPRGPGRPVRARPQPRRVGRIGQRDVPEDLSPVALRDELVELGERFRGYQRLAEPDLALLADLHERKARAFGDWADVVGDGRLRAEADRARQAAETVRRQHRHRTGQCDDGEAPGVVRVLTGAGHWERARTVLVLVRDRAPLPGPQARLLVLMLALRAAHSGSGNLTGQDLDGWPLDDPVGLLGELAGCGWLSVPGDVGEVVASRPESPTAFTVPSLVPGPDGPGPLSFGKNTRAKLSGWAQKVVGERKLRKRRTAAEVRLLALALAARTDPDGALGASGEGLETAALAALCAVAEGEVAGLVEELAAADWLAGAEVAGGRLTGRLTERVLPLSCPLSAPPD
ncbi:hypothetical protein [Streptomyces sp. ODS05-4]|uniref:hypothetical protein n=1 Tax=Streptomyces sp. ODS05-4 TaxID=2944939 RepID=UPI00210AEE7B|nr:hypothetical protein [Streptomyces sp. ODS05-4]